MRDCRGPTHLLTSAAADAISLYYIYIYTFGALLNKVAGLSLEFSWNVVVLNEKVIFYKNVFYSRGSPPSASFYIGK